MCLAQLPITIACLALFDIQSRSLPGRRAQLYGADGTKGWQASQASGALADLAAYSGSYGLEWFSQVRDRKAPAWQPLSPIRRLPSQTFTRWELLVGSLLGSPILILTPPFAPTSTWNKNEENGRKAPSSIIGDVGYPNFNAPPRRNFVVSGLAVYRHVHG